MYIYRERALTMVPAGSSRSLNVNHYYNHYQGRTAQERIPGGNRSCIMRA